MEIETHHAESHDTFGKLIGTQTALLAMVLSIFSILGSQSNTESILLATKTSDQWAHYQAKRIREYEVESNIKLLQIVAAANPQTPPTIAEYTQQENKYQKELAAIKQDADNIVKEGDLIHRKTSYFELAEGILEISMILSSLYFLSKLRLFPLLGLFLGLIGGIIGVLGLLLKG